MLIKRIKNSLFTLWELNGSSFKQTWIPFIQGCTVPSLVETGSVVLEKKIFFNFVNVFALFRNYLPLVKGWALHLNNFESPSPKNELCKVWLKFVQWFLRKRFFFNFVDVFTLFRNYFPLERAGPFIWTILNPLHQRMNCAKFGWNSSSDSWEEDF